jgi:hypothetical protein
MNPYGTDLDARWSPQQRALAGIGAIVVVELLEWVLTLRGQATRAVALRLIEFDASTRRDFRRGQVGMFLAGLSGARSRIG